MVSVVRNEPVGLDLHLISSDVPLRSYAKPGQYVVVRIPDGQRATYALASSPGEPIQLLVKRAGPVGEWLCARRARDRIEVSDALGDGFALERIEEYPLVALVNGSGISAARPVIRAEIARGLPRPVHLFHGVMSVDRQPFREELAAWAAAGVDVVTVLDAEGASGWSGPVGYVQDVAAERGLLRADVGLVLVGVADMIDTARRMWGEAGCPPERMLVNA